jgi:Mn2+/Fe2+ NRAMP family transporter
MAVLTGSLLMGARQDEIGQSMIEPLRIESDDIRITANMLGVACRTLFYIGLFVAAMVSGPVLHITGNVFMTGFAQRALLDT